MDIKYSYFNTHFALLVHLGKAQEINVDKGRKDKLGMNRLNLKLQQ